MTQYIRSAGQVSSRGRALTHIIIISWSLMSLRGLWTVDRRGRQLQCHGIGSSNRVHVVAGRLGIIVVKRAAPPHSSRSSVRPRHGGRRKTLNVLTDNLHGAEPDPVIRALSGECAPVRSVGATRALQSLTSPPHPGGYATPSTVVRRLHFLTRTDHYFFPLSCL